MTKADIVEIVYEKVGYSKKDVAVVIEKNIKKRIIRFVLSVIFVFFVFILSTLRFFSN